MGLIKPIRIHKFGRDGDRLFNDLHIYFRGNKNCFLRTFFFSVISVFYLSGDTDNCFILYQRGI